jgi:hypothetical protein
MRDFRRRESSRQWGKSAQDAGMESGLQFFSSSVLRVVSGEMLSF